MNRKLNNVLVVIGAIIVVLVASLGVSLFTLEVLKLGDERYAVNFLIGILVGWPVGKGVYILWRSKYE